MCHSAPLFTSLTSVSVDKGFCYKLESRVGVTGGVGHNSLILCLKFSLLKLGLWKLPLDSCYYEVLAVVQHVSSWDNPVAP